MKAILRLACYEAFIKKHLDTKIIITEYVNLARAFMDDSEAGFVNAVLDSCLKENLNRA
jgi:N utilization substance protein B